MTKPTRYFLVGSGLLLTIGIATGLVAHYVGLPAGVLFRRGGFEELRYVPSDISLLAFANVREVMASELRQPIHRMTAGSEHGRRAFQDRTGIDLETDVDQVVVCLGREDEKEDASLVLVRGRFDAVKLEALVREQGGRVDVYKGKRLITTSESWPSQHHGREGGQSQPQSGTGVRRDPPTLAFLEPGLLSLGGASMVRRSVDLQTGGPDALSNQELMLKVRNVERNAIWVVGQFDAVRHQAPIPARILDQLPPMTWFSIGAHIDSGIAGTLRVEARSDEAAQNLRDVANGLLALAKLQAGSAPEWRSLLQSLELSGSGRIATLTFSVPATVFERLVGPAL